MRTIDIEFDKDGKNEIGRESHKDSNIHPVPKEYMTLIRKIETRSLILDLC